MVGHASEIPLPTSALCNSQIADILDKWATRGVRIAMGDFTDREILRVAAKRLRQVNNTTNKKENANG